MRGCRLWFPRRLKAPSHRQAEYSYGASLLAVEGKKYCLVDERDTRIIELNEYFKIYPKFKNLLGGIHHDLKDKVDGKYVYSIATTWIQIPISYVELAKLPNGLDFCHGKTLVYPIVNIEDYLLNNA